ncbi:MAG: T9SS type A sorting domain-containing protein [Aureispira sp.]|nr:T9SS type A sorting domain-containing protein [Aureispira sp.]
MHYLKIYLSLWILGYCTSSWAQGGLTNNGASIQVVSNTNIQITAGGVENLSDGNIANAGNLYLDKDWTQTGTTTDYTGNGSVHFKGNTNQFVASSTPLTIANLKVNNGLRLILGNPITVSTNLDLMSNGSMELGSNDLTLSTGCTISNYDVNHFIITNGNGSLIQEVGTIDITYPIGNSIYNPAILNNSGTLDNFSVRVEDQVRTAYPSGSLVTTGMVDKTWFIDETIQGGSDMSVTLQWETSDELSSFDRTKCGVIHWSNSAWDYPATGSTASNIGGNSWSQTRTGITSFSPFAIDDIILTSTPLLVDSEKENTLLIYPNPTKEYLNIKFSSVESSSAIVQIFSADGRLVFNEQRVVDANQSIQLLDLTDLAAGTYLLQTILKNGQSNTQRFIKR